MIVHVLIHPSISIQAGAAGGEAHSTNHQPTQAHMEEDGLCPAHSMLSWHTHYQLTKEFPILPRGGEESQGPDQNSHQLAAL
jgi:hypothetical protein